MNKLLVIVGPTATGKTDIALALAKKFNGELVSCDSRQVYKGLDIGTGKLPSNEGSIEKRDGYWLTDGIPIWGYDVAYPTSQYSVKEYIEDTEKCITDIANRRKLPIVVGGTGLYLRGLLEGIAQLDIPIDIPLRNELDSVSLEEVQRRLQELSYIVWEQLNQSERGNKRRLIRHIERLQSNSKNKIEKCGLDKTYDVLKIGLTAPREVLYRRIDERLKKRIAQGMIAEGLSLQKQGLSLNRLNELGLEYRYLAKLLSNEITKEEFYQQLRVKIHQYAKRQLTWFKKEKNINWFAITEKNYGDNVEKLVQGWYNGDT